jgi:hypothetical protein
LASREGPDIAPNDKPFWSLADVGFGGASRDRALMVIGETGSRTGDCFILVEDVPDYRGYSGRRNFLRTLRNNEQRWEDDHKASPSN